LCNGSVIRCHADSWSPVGRLYALIFRCAAQQAWFPNKEEDLIEWQL
jgi:hypothetical protein